jgi:phage terminase small subunit
MSRGSSAPAHLSDAMRTFYRSIARKYALSEHHRRLLVEACESFDRKVEARAVLATEGLTTTNRHGEARPHPCVAIERDSRIAFVRVIRELGLSDDVPNESRPPRPQGRYAGRA